MRKAKTIPASLIEQLQPGQVYRRADLAERFPSVHRHLQVLVANQTLTKLSRGLYYFPRTSVFGDVPAEEHVLIAAFLRDHRFLITSFNLYNTLGVGTTQLYNTRIVYNYKHHGDIKLGNRNFRFVRKSYVPEKLTKEFLLVDLVNNHRELAEDLPQLMDRVERQARLMDADKLKELAEQFGKRESKELFRKVLADL